MPYINPGKVWLRYNDAHTGNFTMFIVYDVHYPYFIRLEAYHTAYYIWDVFKMFVCMWVMYTV